MTVDAWSTQRVELELTGSTMDGLNSLINYCNQNKLMFDCDAVDNGEGLRFKVVVQCNNEEAYILIRDYKNRGGNA